MTEHGARSDKAVVATADKHLSLLLQGHCLEHLIDVMGIELRSLSRSRTRHAALAHLVFNVIGVIWILCLFYPFVDMVCSFVGYDPDDHSLTTQQLAKRLPIILAAFHTAFNVTNTFVLIWFIPQIERLVCHIIKPKTQEDEEEFRLQYIGGNTIMKTPELSVLEAQKEIQHFAQRVHRMFGFVRELLATTDDSSFAKQYKRIEKYEAITDKMEIEIAKYLDGVSDAHLSDDTKAKIRAMLREISELESIGDSCYNIARTCLSGYDDKTLRKLNIQRVYQGVILDVEATEHLTSSARQCEPDGSKVLHFRTRRWQ